jgi:hypothetical protein
VHTQTKWQTVVALVVGSVIVVAVIVAEVVVTVAEAVAVAAGRRRRTNGCHAPSWVAWCSKYVHEP